MKVYPTMEHLDREGQRMGLRAALKLVGKCMFSNSWTDLDADRLVNDRGDVSDTEAWDRAHKAERQLERLVLDRVVQSVGEDDEGSLTEVTLEQLTKPYFRFAIHRGFLAHPNEWVTMYVNGPQLRAHLGKQAGARPRQNTYKWLPIANEAWRFAIEDQTLPRTQAAIIGHVQDWCSVELGMQADESDLKPLARTITQCLGNSVVGVSPDETPPEGSA